MPCVIYEEVARRCSEEVAAMREKFARRKREAEEDAEKLRRREMEEVVDAIRSVWYITTL